MIVLYAYLFMLVFYTLYIAAINIFRDWDALPNWVKVLIWPIPLVMIGFFDIPFNLIAATVLFLDLPMEFTFTDRMIRYRSDKYPAGIRKTVATTICTQALNPFDPTKHHC